MSWATVRVGDDMSAIIHPARRSRHLQTIENTPKPMAKVSLQNLEAENGGRILRKAIAYAGLTSKEAAYLCGVADASQFNRMLDGVEKFPVHLLLRKSARPILHELLILSAVEQGTAVVERVVRLTESA